MHAEPIFSFKGEYAFLSNFYPSPIVVGYDAYPTVEHAFQAAKTLDLAEARRVRDAATPGKAKYAGRRVTLRPDWDQVKLAVMEALLRQKFARGSELAGQLLATGDRELIEGNRWGDRFWGTDLQGNGRNELGRALMRIRDDLR